MRLVNGTVDNEGRLEVCLNGVWGGVAPQLFDLFNAVIICNILGYNNGGMPFIIIINLLLILNNNKIIIHIRDKYKQGKMNNYRNRN